MNKTVPTVVGLILCIGVLVWSTSLLGFQFKTTVGTSMEPVISQSDIVVIRTNFKDLSRGDIICFKYQINGEEYLFLHRIIEVDDLIRTKGDNISEPDPYPVNRSDIIGKVVLVIPTGRLFRAMHSVYGLVLLIIVPAALLIWIELREVQKMKKN